MTFKEQLEKLKKLKTINNQINQMSSINTNYEELKRKADELKEELDSEEVEFDV